MQVHKLIAVGTVCAVLGGGGVATATTTGLIDGHTIKKGSIPTNRLTPAAQHAIDRAMHARGPKGAVGHPGSAGPQGPKGQDGQDGAKGDKGDVGPQGPAGPIAPMGPEGPAGKDGSNGINGSTDVVVRTQTYSVPEGIQFITAMCNAGERATGGGSSGNVQATQSVPVTSAQGTAQAGDTPQGWGIYANNPAVPAATATVYVVCASP